MEFIGKELAIKDGNIIGKIINETKNTFLVKYGSIKRIIQKKGGLFEIREGGCSIIVEGNLILMRPEERIRIEK